ncbi:hypothetical protein FCV25MIE_15126 [Fagus crenata]
MREKLNLICSSINPIFVEINVAEAMFEITLTRFSGDILPATDAGIVLSIADRLKGNKLRSSSFCPCRAGKLAFSGSKVSK